MKMTQSVKFYINKYIKKKKNINNKETEMDKNYFFFIKCYDKSRDNTE